MTSQPLSYTQRRAIHDLALDARSLLTREARELLEGTYGLYADGRLDPPEKLPQVQTDPEVGETYRRLAQFLEDEEAAGLARPEAAEKLVKEAAFTHLNRLVAFKMMEARGLIRGTLDRHRPRARGVVWKELRLHRERKESHRGHGENEKLSVTLCEISV